MTMLSLYGRAIFLVKQISSNAKDHMIKKTQLLKMAALGAYCCSFCGATSQNIALNLTSNIVVKPLQINQPNSMVVRSVLTLDRHYGTLLSCKIGIGGHTNIIGYRPISTQAFDAHLFDENGKEIAKTFYGRSYGLPLNPDKKLLDGTWVNDLEAGYGHGRLLDFVHGYANNPEWKFEMLKTFRIKEPGEYRLKVQVRLFTKDTNGIFQPFILPPVETKVNISESDLGK